MRAIAVGLVLPALLAASCGGPAEVVGPPSDVARDARFELRLSSPKGMWAAGESIELETTLLPLAPGSVVARGSGSGLVIFVFEQLDGPLDVGGGATADCATYELEGGVPFEVPMTKSGGWSEDDPNAPLLRAFLTDPLLRPPPGTWRISAMADFYEDECGREHPHHELTATIVVRVGG